MARQSQDHDALVPGRRVSPDIPETQVGSQQTQASQARTFRDLLVTGGRHAHASNVNRLVTGSGDHAGYGARKIGVDDESQTDSRSR